jgi:hypothetical protein
METKQGTMGRFRNTHNAFGFAAGTCLIWEPSRQLRPWLEKRRVPKAEVEFWPGVGHPESNLTLACNVHGGTGNLTESVECWERYIDRHCARIRLRFEEQFLPPELVVGAEALESSGSGGRLNKW